MPTKRRCVRHLPMLASSVWLGCCVGGCGGPDIGRTDEGPEFGLPGPPPLASIMPLAKPEGLDRRKVALGKALFNDKRLSADGSIACSSCHDLTAGGDDGRPTAVGIDDRVGPFNTPTVFNSSLNVAQFWDGRASSLEQQIDQTVQSPLQMGADWATVERRLRADRQMTKRFEAVLGAPPSAEGIKQAIAEYVRALVTIDAPFDRFISGDRSAMEPDAVEGYELFRRLGCISCHQGRNVGGNFFQRIGVMDDYFADRATGPRKSDLGRFNVTGREEDRYKFKVPSLRNVAQTAPYFHEGSAETLEDAVRTMVRVQLGRPVREDEIGKLVAFLEALTGKVDDALL